MTPKQALQYWRNIKETILPILEYAEEESPEDYERIINTVVLPEIFGDGTKVTLKHVAGLNGKLDGDSIAGFIGRNFNATRLETPAKEAISYLHRHPIDEAGDIVVGAMFQQVGGERSSDLLVPLSEEYTSMDLSTIEKSFSVSKVFGVDLLGSKIGGAIYEAIKDTDNKDAASYAPVVDADVYGDQPYGAGRIRAISDLGRARILGCLTSDFEGQFRVVNPEGYVRSFPVDPSDGLRHPDLNEMVSFYATTDGDLIGGKGFSGFYSITYPRGQGSVVFREGEFTRVTINHEMMHHFLFAHPHQDPVIRGESIAMALRMRDPLGPSILNYESAINPEAPINRDGLPNSEPRPLDLVIISLNRFCSKDAIAHNVTRNRYDDLADKVTDFAKVDPDLFRATTTPIKRVMGSSLRNFAMVEAPLAILETSLEKFAKSNPDSCFAFGPSAIKGVSGFMRATLNCLNFGLGAGLISGAMEGGAAFLGSRRCQEALKSCSAKTGFDQTAMCKKLEEGYKACQNLSPAVKQFGRQFLMTFASTAVGEYVGYRSISHGGYLYSAAYNLSESMSSSALTGFFSAAFRQTLRKVVGLGSAAAKVAHAGAGGVVEEESDLEGGAASVQGEHKSDTPAEEVRGAVFVRGAGAASRPKEDKDLTVVDLDEEKADQPEAMVSEMFGGAGALARSPDPLLSPSQTRGASLLVKEAKRSQGGGSPSFQ